MKRYLLLPAVLFCVASAAQVPVIDIIKEGIKKVIIAADIKVQKLQNKVIWLQQAQKVLENAMSKLRLDEVSDWVAKQKDLYADYFDELRKVKVILSSYQKVRDIIEQVSQTVREFQSAWALFRQDKYFLPEELDYMLDIYKGIMEEGEAHIDQLFLVIHAFATQMTDARRLEIIDAVSIEVEQNLLDIKEFNEQSKVILLQRAHEQGDVDYVRRLYGL